MAGLRNSLLASAATVMVVPTSGAWAQDQETESQDENVIVVTARKQAETLQDVPISVAVTQGETLRSNVVTTLEDFTQNSPTVTVTRTPVSDAIYIRGVGSGTSVGFQQSVGTFVDGVYRGRGPAARSAFLDIERIEVLRGPQPVYFGNSTVGGAFNIVSRGPTDSLEVNAQTSYEFNADEWVTEVGVGGPLNDIVGVRVAYNHTESDGWLTDTVRNERVPVVNNDAVRGTLVVDPASGFDATFKVEYSENEEVGGLLQVVECNPSVAPVFGPACNPSIFGVPGFEDELDFRLARGGVFPNGKVQEDGNFLDLLNISLGMNYEFGDGHTLSSVTGLVDYDNRRLVDVDAGPGPSAFAQADRTEDFQQWSQELRLTSPQDQPLTYLLGLYYEDGELDYLQRSSNGRAGPPGNPLFDGVLSEGTFVQDQTTFALFGSVAYEITDRLTLSVGARWSDVDTDAVKRQRTLTLDGDPASPALIAAAAAPGPNPRDEHDLSGSRTDRDLTPSIEIQYEPVPEVTLYASYKEAFKTGGFDPQIQLAVLALPTPLDPNGGFEFDDEQAEAFEIGAKMSLLDNTLILNLAAFHTDFTNLQVASFDSATNSFVTGNAAGARTRGIELEATWRATDYLSFNTSMTLLDGEFTEFDTAQCNREQQAAFVPMGPGDQCITSIDGQTLPFAPDFSGNVGYNLDLPITDTLNLVSTGAMNFTTEFTWGQNPDPIEIQEGFVKFDARIGVSGNDGQWELAFYGRNLTDEVTFRFLGELPGPSGRFALVDRRRELGIQARFNY
ncbi:MAG: TonB-dependent receptor [Pseudomonadota bacterium]